MLNIKKVLCAIAGSEESKWVLDVAVDIAERHQASLTVLNVAPLSIIDLMQERGHLVGSEDLLSQQVEERLDRRSAAVLADARAHLGDKPASYERIVGRPGQVICEFAESGGFDLVVVGHRKHSLLQGMLGSVTGLVVQQCSRAVLVVKSSSPSV